MKDFDAIREKLVELADTAQNNTYWLEFMKLYKAELPFTFDPSHSRGKYPAELVAESVVGKSGYTSTSEFRSAAPEDKGLGVKTKTYEKWRQAFVLVLDNEYLGTLNLGHTQIVGIGKDAEKYELDMPKSPEEHEQFIAAVKDKKAELKEAAMNELYDVIDNLKVENKVLKAKLAALEKPGLLVRIKRSLIG